MLCSVTPAARFNEVSVTEPPAAVITQSVWSWSRLHWGSGERELGGQLDHLGVSDKHLMRSSSLRGNFKTLGPGVFFFFFLTRWHSLFQNHQKKNLLGQTHLLFDQTAEQFLAGSAAEGNRGISVKINSLFECLLIDFNSLLFFKTTIRHVYFRIVSDSYHVHIYNRKWYIDINNK